MNVLNRFEGLSIIQHPNNALDSLPSAPSWGSPGWDIRAARDRLLAVMLADVDVETTEQSQ